jgi:hypothetical protein
MLYSFQPLIRIIIKVEEVKAIAKLFSQQYSNEIVVHNIHARQKYLKPSLIPADSGSSWRRVIESVLFLDKI